MGRGDVKFSLFFALKVLFHLCALLAIVCVCLGWLITSFDELCDAESSESPVGRYVYRDIVCGESIWVTEEYCRYFGGKLKNNRCDAAYALFHRKRCEAVGGVFVYTGWLEGRCDFREKCRQWKVSGKADIGKPYPTDDYLWFAGSPLEHGSLTYFEENGNAK